MFDILLRVMFSEKIYEVVFTFIKHFTMHALSENNIV